MHMHRMGLNPFLTFYIDAMLNFDDDVDADAKANVKCEHTVTYHCMRFFPDICVQYFSKGPFTQVIY